MTATHPYAQFLGNRDPFEVLAETQKSIPALAQKLGPEGLKRSYAPGKWSAAQVLAHLADCEVAFGFRVRQIVSQPDLPIQTFDENKWAAHYDRANGAEAAQAFQALRAFNVSTFRHLTLEERQRASKHPDRGPETADTVIRILAGHTLNHLAQLEKIAALAA